MTDPAGRLFLAVPIVEPVRGALERWMATVRPQLPALRFVRAENLHLTLRFCPDTPRAAGEALVAALPGIAAAARGPLALAVRGLGVFPSLSRPRVLWAGLGGDVAALERLAVAAETAAREAGLAADERAFRAHLTLARAAERGGAARLPIALDPDTPDFGTLRVDQIVLMRSHLGAGGPRYASLAAAALVAPEASAPSPAVAQPRGAIGERERE